MASRIKLLLPYITNDEPVFELPQREPDHTFKFLNCPLLSGVHSLEIWYVGETEDMIRTYVSIDDMGGGWAGAYLRRVEPWEMIGDMLCDSAIAQGHIEGEDLLDPESTWTRR